jgi:hypothetical protein
MAHQAGFLAVWLSLFFSIQVSSGKPVMAEFSIIYFDLHRHLPSPVVYTLAGLVLVSSPLYLDTIDPGSL